ncbi:hypothetical protein [Galbibacter mesophilus]|uniref:hypothetical protein n=1 Tax=Galbibacter mesophilus TaxID=379069 RepID=UPI00191FBC55|nr:hypothetical protein [Galbibacter mesophilus]MCM5663564.1 hypothetical protein [Galbibacter mesophilus]
MRITLIILSIITAILGIIFTVLPLGTIALLPIGLTLIFVLILKFKFAKGQNPIVSNILLGIAVVCLIAVVAKGFLSEEEVVEDTQYEQRLEESQEEAVEELEEIESELEGLEEDIEIEEELDSIN